MGITHDSLAVQAFKREHGGRAPVRSLNLRSPDEAWIQKWIADHVAQKCRQDPAYAHYFALLTTRRRQRRSELRLKAAGRTPQR